MQLLEEIGYLGLPDVAPYGTAAFQNHTECKLQILLQVSKSLVAHDCGHPCRATRVALHVSQLISWILKRFAGVAPVSRYTP